MQVTYFVAVERYKKNHKSYWLGDAYGFLFDTDVTKARRIEDKSVKIEDITSQWGMAAREMGYKFRLVKVVIRTAPVKMLDG